MDGESNARYVVVVLVVGMWTRNGRDESGDGVVA